MNIRNRLILIALLAALVSAPMGMALGAERYTLVTGKKNALCQRFKAYLEQVTDQYNIPPNCSTSFGQEFPEFADVKWREVDPKDHPDLSAQAYRYLNYWPWDRPEVAARLTKQKEDDARGVVFQHRHGWWRMWLAEADIDNDGRPDKLLKVEDGRCGDRGPRAPYDWRVPVMVLNDSQTDIDTVKSELILGVSELPATPTLGITGLHGIGNEVYDVVLFENSALFYRWQDNWPIVVGRRYDGRHAAVSVYRIQRGRTETVCRFKFSK